MKAILSAVFAVLVLASLHAYAGSAIINLSVSGEISPGVYGQVQFGNAPPPPVLFAQPVVIAPQPVMGVPLYLHVPPGHAKKWAKHCHKYNACNQPVYFVKSAEYEPDYGKRKDRKHRGEGHDDDDRGGSHRGDEGRGKKGHKD